MGVFFPRWIQQRYPGEWFPSLRRQWQQSHTSTSRALTQHNVPRDRPQDIQYWCSLKPHWPINLMQIWIASVFSMQRFPNTCIYYMLYTMPSSRVWSKQSLYKATLTYFLLGFHRVSWMNQGQHARRTGRQDMLTHLSHPRPIHQTPLCRHQLYVKWTSPPKYALSFPRESGTTEVAFG